MKNFWDGLDTWQKWAVGILSLVILYGAARWIASIGSGPRDENVDWANVPDIGTDDQGQPVKWNPDPLANDLYSCMDGANVLTGCEHLYQDLLNLQTDDQVRLLYNHFNENYASEGEDLISWINSEWYTSFGTDLGKTRNEAVARLKRATKKN